MANKRFEALVSLNMISEIGSIRLGKLLEFFGTPEAILNAPQAQLEQVYGIGRQISAQIHNFKQEDLEKELALAKKHQITIITRDDAVYPENLKTISDPPIVLYVKGTLLPEDSLAMGIVGSRRASWYGLECAKRFAFELSAKGFTIVSGMARGVDTASHRGALEQGGRTIAVIGSGFNHIYPEENRKLADEIAACGAVISEFPFDAQPLKQHFPQRNRVISGLSLGVLVVEAARNSGALITADFALEQGREVFALPGKVDSHTSYGTNGLIKQGAKLVTTVEDVLEEIVLPVIQRRKDLPRGQVSQKQREVSQEESAVYQLLQEEPLALDELVEKTNMDISRISGILLKLELKKLIKQLSGKLFVLNH